MRPHLAITMGDPAGIGPEIIVKACERLRDRLDAGELRLLVIGSCPALRAARAQLGTRLDIPEVARRTATGRPSPACRPGRRGSRSCPACSRPMAAGSPISRSSAACGWPKPGGSGASSPRPSTRRR